jgi:hypothetical protein
MIQILASKKNISNAVHFFGCINWHNHFRKQLEVSKVEDEKSALFSSSVARNMWPREILSHRHKKFIEALFTVMKIWRHMSVI